MLHELGLDSCVGVRFICGAFICLVAGSFAYLLAGLFAYLAGLASPPSRAGALAW